MNRNEREGWLYVDNRLGGGAVSEFKTSTCGHCQGVVVLHPQRTRPRGFCRKCNSYVCDACEAVRASTLECRTMDRVIDEYLESAERGSPTIILPR